MCSGSIRTFSPQPDRTRALRDRAGLDAASASRARRATERLARVLPFILSEPCRRCALGRALSKPPLQPLGHLTATRNLSIRQRAGYETCDLARLSLKLSLSPPGSTARSSLLLLHAGAIQMRRFSEPLGSIERRTEWLRAVLTQGRIPFAPTTDDLFF